ncbi:MAG: class I SAM-dependent methyltransferase [Thermodesulfovibrionales bacterium]|nr:class I SAM-dependent methyltransferase [Thermodesulfovibrionales bacterium]
MKLPENFNDALGAVLKTATPMEGYLTDREMKFLFLLGASPAAEGEVLEVGSFKGKSTVLLASALRLIGGGSVVAVDPLTSPSVTDPSLMGKESGWEDFQANIGGAGVRDKVEFHRMFSHELSKGWDRKLRLLWIDGDHTYEGAKADFDMFSPFLNDGAIVALHDVLNLGSFDGPFRVFMEDILLSERFGPAGLCGTIGWGRYLSDERKCRRCEGEKMRLYSKLRRLKPFAVTDKPIRGMRKIKYKILRFLVPHSEISPEKWLKEAGLPG